MRSFRRDRAFDPLDLEIIDRVYEAAWARVETDIFRDIAKDDERKTALRQWASIRSKPWITAPTQNLRGSPPQVGP